MGHSKNVTFRPSKLSKTPVMHLHKRLCVCGQCCICCLTEKWDNLSKPSIREVGPVRLAPLASLIVTNKYDPVNNMSKTIVCAGATGILLNNHPHRSCMDFFLITVGWRRWKNCFMAVERGDIVMRGLTSFLSGTIQNRRLIMRYGILQLGFYWLHI